MKYKASYDTLTKVMSIGIFIILSVVAERKVKALLFEQVETKMLLIDLGIIIFFILAIGVGYLFSIQYYLVDNSELIIKRPIGEKKIPIADIEEIRLVNNGEMRGTIRTFGNGGLFGYYGKYYNLTFGSMTLYTTQKRNRVFIRTKSGDKVIISPDDLSLVDKLKRH